MHSWQTISGANSRTSEGPWVARPVHWSASGAVASGVGILELRERPAGSSRTPSPGGDRPGDLGPARWQAALAESTAWSLPRVLLTYDDFTVRGRYHDEPQRATFSALFAHEVGPGHQ